MKKTLILIAVLVLPFSHIFAGFYAKAIGGYNWVDMDNLNANIDAAYDDAAADPETSYVYKEYVVDGWFIGVDGGYSFFQGFSAGLRFLYLGTFPSRIQLDSSDLPLGFESATAYLTAVLVPVMAGASYSYTIPGLALSVGAEAYGGYGFGSLNAETTMSSEYLAVTTVETFAGGCFCFDTALKVSWAFTSLFSAGLNVGYRFANVEKLKYTKTGVSVPTITDYSEDLSLDFSGLKIEASANFNF